MDFFQNVMEDRYSISSGLIGYLIMDQADISPGPTTTLTGTQLESPHSREKIIHLKNRDFFLLINLHFILIIAQHNGA